MATLAQNHTDQRFQRRDGEAVIDWLLRTDAMLAQLIEAGRDRLDTSLVNAVISFPVADGHAHYQIVQEEPLTLRYLPTWEGYQASSLSMASLTLEEARRMIRDPRAAAPPLVAAAQRVATSLQPWT